MKLRGVGKILFSAVSLWLVFAPIAYSKSGETWTPRTELSLAAYYGQYQKLLTLIENGHEVNQQDGDGFTALMWAVLGAELECTKQLLQEGADFHLKNRNGSTALAFALETYNKSIHGLPNKGSWDPNAYSEISRLLIEIEPDLEAHNLDIDGALGRMIGGKYNDIYMFRYFLSLKPDINAQDEYGWNLLLSACASRRQAYVKELIDHGADVNVVNDLFNGLNGEFPDGATPLKLAGNHAEIIRLLKEAGAKE